MPSVWWPSIPLDSSQGIIPANRITTWQPGVTYNGGIPTGGTVFTTLSPRGSGLDDTVTINTAIVNAGAQAISSGTRQIVQLNAGTFLINATGFPNNSVLIRVSNVTLRGAGPGTGASGGVLGNDASSVLVGGGTGTFLLKNDRQTETSNEVIAIGYENNEFSANINLAFDAVKGSHSCVLASNPGIAVGEMVLIDHNTDDDSDVVWGPAHGPAGAEFIGSIAGTTLTISQFVRNTPTSGMTIWAANVQIGTSIVSGSGSTWTVSPSQTVSSQWMGAGSPSRAWFCRQDRSKNQIMKVTNVNGNTITFETPFHITFKTQFTAQLSRYLNPVLTGVGVEELCIMGGMGGDGHGNIAMATCMNSWIKHVEAYWSTGTSIGLYSTYRCELRDSYIHETPDPNPGGGGYQLGLAYGAADCLIENCISWNGNKEIVMRGTGGGNVIAYNYMDDAFGSTYPESPEAGLNAAHFTTSHMELLEGNHSQNFKGDSYWGNSIYITVHRNHLKGVRAAHPPLNTYTTNQGGTIYPYGDYNGRTCVDVQAYSYFQNFTGNVLGFNGQTLLSYSSATFNITQNLFLYENITAFVPNTTVPMWQMGIYQAPEAISQPDQFITDTYATQLRQGNWDWFTQTQTWLGIGGTQGSPLGTPQSMPNSFYLTSKPAFFGSNPWPWVDPSTGTVHTLPAKARFDNGTPNTVL